MTKRNAETDICAAVKAAFEAAGATVWRNNCGAVKTRGHMFRYGLKRGSADLIGCFEGRFLSIEVKRPGARTDKKHREEQCAWAAEVTAAGGWACVVSSVEEARELTQDLSWYMPGEPMHVEVKS